MKGAFLSLLALLLSGCQGYKYNDDNVAEEILEVGIGVKSGVDIDLTPKTPEKGFSPTSLKPWEKVVVVEPVSSEAAASTEGK